MATVPPNFDADASTHRTRVYYGTLGAGDQMYIDAEGAAYALAITGTATATLKLVARDGATLLNQPALIGTNPTANTFGVWLKPTRKIAITDSAGATVQVMVFYHDR